MVDGKQNLCGVRIPWKLLKDEGRKSSASVLPFFESQNVGGLIFVNL